MFSDQVAHALIGAAKANGIKQAALCTGNPTTFLATLFTPRNQTGD
jgi:hypothetical protein